MQLAHGAPSSGRLAIKIPASLACLLISGCFSPFHDYDQGFVSKSEYQRDKSRCINLAMRHIENPTAYSDRNDSGNSASAVGAGLKEELANTLIERRIYRNCMDEKYHRKSLGN